MGQPRKQTEEGSLLHYKQHSVAYQLNLLHFLVAEANHQAAQHTHGAAGPSRLDAHAWKYQIHLQSYVF